MRLRKFNARHCGFSVKFGDFSVRHCEFSVRPCNLRMSRITPKSLLPLGLPLGLPYVLEEAAGIFKTGKASKTTTKTASWGWYRVDGKLFDVGSDGPDMNF